MKKYLLILCALLLTAVGASAQTVVHSCVAEIDDWTIEGNTNGDFHYDDWAGEADESGMVTPFLEYWIGSWEGNLSAATISHKQLTDLTAGYYEVSLDIRIFSEAGNEIGSGATFTANTVSEDIVSGSDSHSGVYGTETEVYGTYRLLVYVENGTLDISLTIPENATYNWIAFKNLEVTYLGDSPVGYVAHDCEAVLGHWTLVQSGNNGIIQRNTWSTEADASGMVTPWIEYWVGTWDGTLSAATISHETITGLTAGYYEVSIDIRIFSEAGNEITVGGTLSANSASEDLLSGSDIHSGTYGTETEVYGTCHLLTEVTEAGTLDISLVIPSGVAYNWISFKNLKVVYDGDAMPDLEYVTGDMNADVETAMKTAVDTYNNNKSSDNYTAALAAIEEAEESVAQYAEIAALVANLDTNGATVWAETESASKYNGKTLTTSDDISEDMVAAQLAQTTPDSDMTYTLLNTGTWVNAINATNFQMCPSLPTAHEVWSQNAWTLGTGETSRAAIYKQIEDLPAGTYTISFYAYGSEGVNASRPLAYANDAETEVAYAAALEWNESSLYTLTCIVDKDGVLDFGMKTQGDGNWYVMEEGSLTLVALADDHDYAVGDEIDVHNFSGTVASGNLFVNGGFNNGVEGWTAGSGYTNALSESSDVTISQSGGYNDGPYISVSNTGANGSNVPTQAIAVEPGKSYLLVGYTKYSGSNLPDSRYSSLFIMDSETAERSHHEDASDANYSDGLVELQFENTGEWVKTEGVFTVPAENEDGTFSHVGMRMNWSTASYDGLQLYEVEGEFNFPEDADYAIDDKVTVNGVVYAVVGENIVENGSFNERTTGWTYGRDHEGDLYPYNVIYSTDGGYNDGPYITSRGGGSDANTTPSKEVDVVAGKTYLFVGYTNGTAPSTTNQAYNGLFKMSNDTSEDRNVDAIVKMTWGDGDEELNGWTKTEAVFTAETDYVGIRFAWCPGASIDGIQIYEVEATGDVVIDWELAEVEWGTMIIPFDAEVPEGMTAYAGSVITVSGSDLVLGDAAESIEANVPYLVTGTPAVYSFTGVPTNDADAYTVGVLTGTLVDMEYEDFVPGTGQYVLQNHTVGGLAFYQVTTNSVGVELAAHHCYLTYTGAEPTALNLPGMATGIEAVESDLIANDAIYDLSGRKVSKAVKGVYIINGKKVLVK